MTPYQDPEIASRRMAQEDWNRREAERVQRMEYIKPGVMLAVGFVITLLLAAASGEDATAGLIGSAIVFPVVLAVQVVAGVIGLLIVSVLWMGGAGALGLGILRMAGVCAVSNIALFILGPLGCLGLPAIALIYTGLIAWLFDVELLDAAAVAVVSFLLIVGSMVGMALAFG